MEIWKNIVGYEGKYLISNKGNVKSLINKNGGKQDFIRKPRVAKNGYHYLNLFKSSKSKTYKIHRLVAEYFIDNPNNYPCVNHKDGNKLNNDVSNLEWCTYSYNTCHAIKSGLLVMPRGKDNYMFNRHGKDNPHSIKVKQYDLDGNFIKEWENIKIAQVTLGINHISDCCNGKRKTAGNYKWEVA